MNPLGSVVMTTHLIRDGVEIFFSTSEQARNKNPLYSNGPKVKFYSPMKPSQIETGYDLLRIIFAAPQLKAGYSAFFLGSNHCIDFARHIVE
jgi:hypothetical protein